jgi:hypothetical protein
MTYRARARRTDSNHAEIASAFTRLGWLVHHTNGDWDLTLARSDRVLLIEIKDGAKVPSARRLTKNESRMQSMGWPIQIVLSIDDVLSIDRLYRLP